ncbi:SDR family oxidoreductase [Polymorphobacter fuscus]|uniref:SDR family oxidoreductase n=1 Tax=Sandarakinorhabdus fusca TaxID=1439888 RepID=A0A7C9KMU1_9SPHN|nr:SDR family oxidoreductase [Polymorphobacter fuscus]KAB7644829.1 SDR family oxidoreductase [Polymorphobacter fuscus]MQT18103.1 SDR family oxidoreductase [Polymorphobacter fuscus]NJC09421.1 NAD(P)-dependent dehydrogenase (short-subunit alcohol dehydrogenase family) [Polymorphobacter fuscus]
MAGKTAIIIGASRGLGLGLAAELAKRGWQVTATQRTESAALADAASAGGITVETVDIDDPASVAALAARQPGPFDLLFINAGVTGPKATADTVDAAGLAGLMMTNAVSPVRTARTLLGHVAPGGTVAFMTSILGSVELRTHAHAELYSASKAALNSLTRGFAAVEGKEHAVLSLHPGWVKTDMGGDGADIDVATSVAGLADVLESRPAAGHHYLDYTGKTLPW